MVDMSRLRFWHRPDTTLSPRGTRVVHCSMPVKNEHFADNRVKNTKYEWYSFIPKNLAEQFSLHINRYFLFIACLQLISVITPVNPLTTWGPLAVIFAISAAKEFVDDRGRARADREANERRYLVVRGERLVPTRAAEIEVGDIVQVREDEELPCDLVLLRASAEDGTAFLQTTNLDGESNLNLRRPLAQTQEMSNTGVETFAGVIECAAPNASLYKFDSRLWLESSFSHDVPVSEPLSLSADQLLQQATTLRNTEWIYGAAVYTGNETKFGKNKGDTPQKWTRTDVLINKLSVILFVLQLGLVVVFGTVGEIWRAMNDDEHSYLQYSLTESEWYTFLIVPARFLLLISTIIPISLKVSLDVCKLYYARFINWDTSMYDGERTHKFAHCNNTAISEDLGQIEYVLSDKTGTLTNNEMVYKCAALPSGENDVLVFSGGLVDPKSELRQFVENEAVAANDGTAGPVLHSYLCNLLLNSSVLPEALDAPDKYGVPMKFHAASPDEEALVRAAWQCGYKLLARQNDLVTVEIRGAQQKWLILAEMEFNSDRKRMSVLCVRADAQGRRLADSPVLLLCKGADDMVGARLCQADANRRAGVQEHVDEFAASGLRTLMYGGRSLTPQQADDVLERLRHANTLLEGREEAREALYDEVERDLFLHGASAIEDLLQDQVPETIAKLRQANVKFWMLTGDKFSTALQIATTCNLKTSSDPTDLFEIHGISEDEVGDELRRHTAVLREKVAAGSIDVTVILKGASLEACLTFHQALFEELCLTANAVICSRVTPRQKAQLVDLVKRRGYMTLGIGDGGNDVQMLQAANIGVGIRGKEGLQAARAADYQVNFFRSLAPLMMVHGRLSYQRTALVAQYSYYKSFLFCFLQLSYAFWSGFSGVTLFNSLCVAAYNAILFLPILTFAMDRDVSVEASLRHPVLYRVSQASAAFNPQTFFMWVLRACGQGLLMVLLTFGWLARDASAGTLVDGYGLDYETLGLAPFVSFLWVQTLTMLTELSALSWLHVVVIGGFHVLSFGVLALASGVLSFDSLMGYGSFAAAAAQPAFWLFQLLVLVACLLPVHLIRMARRAHGHVALCERIRVHEKERGMSTRSGSSTDSDVELSPGKAPSTIGTPSVTPAVRVHVDTSVTNDYSADSEKRSAPLPSPSRQPLLHASDDTASTSTV